MTRIRSKSLILSSGAGFKKAVLEAAKYLEASEEHLRQKPSVLEVGQEVRARGCAQVRTRQACNRTSSRWLQPGVPVCWARAPEVCLVAPCEVAAPVRHRSLPAWHRLLRGGKNRSIQRGGTVLDISKRSHVVVHLSLLKRRKGRGERRARGEPAAS